jgi:hypothetical protein
VNGRWWFDGEVKKRRFDEVCLVGDCRLRVHLVPFFFFVWWWFGYCCEEGEWEKMGEELLRGCFIWVFYFLYFFIGVEVFILFCFLLSCFEISMDIFWLSILFYYTFMDCLLFFCLGCGSGMSHEMRWFHTQYKNERWERI